MRAVDKISRDKISFRSQVADSIRNAILDGRFKAGQNLVERELCLDLDISRTLLREALQELRAEGLISLVPHKGPAVAQISISDLNEIYAVRKALESLIGYSFALNATDQQVKNLREQMDSLNNPETLQTTREIILGKVGFYNVLYDGCGNLIAVQFLKQLNNKLLLCKSMSLSKPGRAIEMVRELDAVVSAIEAREPGLASQLFSIHISNASKAARACFLDEERGREDQES